MDTIRVKMKDGTVITWEGENWDDYSYDGKVLIVKKNGAWEDIYNIDCIQSVFVKHQDASTGCAVKAVIGGCAKSTCDFEKISSTE